MAAEESLKIVIEAEIKDLSAKLKDAQSRLNAVAGSAAKLNKAVAGTNTTLVNFGRVIQDAPFGLIGIANNIDPLISSFRQLSAETKNTGGPLRALAAGLVGPAGIAIGVSAVTSLLVAFGDEIAAAISGVTRFDQAQRDAGEAGATAFFKATQGFERYLDVLDNANTSSQRQENILKQVNSQLDDYGLKINSVADLQRVGAQVGAIYADIKREEAKAQILAAEAAKEYAKQVRLGILAEQGDVFGLFGQFNFADQFKALTSGGDVTKFFTGYANAIGKSADAQQKFNQAAASSEAQIEVLRQALLETGGVSEFFGGATNKSTQNLKTNTKETEKQLRVLYGIRQVESEITAERLRRRQQEQQDRVRGLVNALDNPLGAPGDLAQRFTIPTAILDSLREYKALQQSITDEYARLAENAVVAFNLLTPAIDQTFNALANGQNVFAALGQAVKRLIVDLLKAAALATILAFIPGGGGGAAIAGIFTKLLGFRANGGPVGGREPFIVGERGPELFVPNTSGSIVSNTNLRPGNGGQLLARISGNDLLVLLNRAEGQRGRWG